jgi:TPR repeat protein
MRQFIFAILGGLLPSFCPAATIERVDGEPTLLVVSGELQLGDEKRFVGEALPLDEAFVVLSSEGGNVYAALEIAKAIRLKGFPTIVPEGHRCASACALAWLAGQTRFMGPDAEIGFHAVYEMNDGKPTERGAANALVGAYLNSLGFSEAAIYYITSSPPEGMNWLTPEAAVTFGIDVQLLESATAEKPPEISECDSLAAVPNNADNPPSVTGVYFWTLVPQADLAVDACRSAVESSPDTRRFMLQLGRALHAAGESREALAWWEKAAEQGSASAITYVGLLYLSGVIVRKDEREAARLFHRAAELGDPEGMSSLAVMYERGLGGEAQDFSTALDWYSKAIQLGDGSAMAHLGYLYAHGYGVPQDWAESRRWYLQAAKLGVPEGMHGLARYLSRGIGGETDFPGAARLLIQIIILGYPFIFDELRLYPTAYNVEVRREIQRFLIARGYLDGEADGIFGRATKTALTKYEYDHGTLK